MISIVNYFCSNRGSLPLSKGVAAGVDALIGIAFYSTITSAVKAAADKVPRALGAVVNTVTSSEPQTVLRVVLGATAVIFLANEVVKFVKARGQSNKPPASSDSSSGTTQSSSGVTDPQIIMNKQNFYTAFTNVLSGHSNNINLDEINDRLIKVLRQFKMSQFGHASDELLTKGLIMRIENCTDTQTSQTYRFICISKIGAGEATPPNVVLIQEALTVSCLTQKTISVVSIGRPPGGGSKRRGINNLILYEYKGILFRFEHLY